MTFNIADFGKQWNESQKITSRLIASATQIRIGGTAKAEGTTKDNPSTLTIDLTSIYLESDLDYIISNAEDWADFASKVNDGTKSNAKASLAANISVTTMVGTADHPYTGTFNGAGHTLTFTYNGSGQFVAPFQYVNGATILDLKTAGSITTTDNQCGGIIGKNTGGSTTLNRCMSSAVVTCNAADNGRVGGLAGRCTDGSLTFNYCMFDGEVHCTGKDKLAAGFVGYCDVISTKITIKNSLVAVTADKKSGDGDNFVGGYKGDGDFNFTNAYYLKKFGSSTQGTLLDDQLLNSGQAAWVLNGGIADGAWFFGQGNVNASNVEAFPTLTTDPTKKVVRTKASGTSTDLYVNPGGAVPNAVRLKATGFSMTDGGELVTNVPSSFTTDDVQIYRTKDSFKFKVGAAGATTLVVPFTTTGLPDNVKAYDLTFDGSVVNAEEVDHLTANQPV